MAIKGGNSSVGKFNLEKFIRVLSLGVLAFLLVMAGSVACKKEAAEQTDTQKDIIEFEGIAKVGIGKYLFVPEVQGFDIVVQGQIDSSDTSMLVDKEIRGVGEFSPERPSILIADRIDVKESGRNWRNVFTRTEDVVLDDYFDIHTRDEFATLEGISFDKKESWEGKGKGKVYGRLVKETVTEGEEQVDKYMIVVLNEEDAEVGQVLVDSISDSALYYVRKLRYFEKFWFYLDIKDTVEWKTRVSTSDLFHADVLFSGLF